MEEEWNVWKIENNLLRLIVVWLIVIVLVPPILIIETISRFVLAVGNEYFYHEKGSMREFFTKTREVFSVATWADIWKAMTTWDQDDA